MNPGIAGENGTIESADEVVEHPAGEPITGTSREGSDVKSTQNQRATLAAENLRLRDQLDREIALFTNMRWQRDEAVTSLARAAQRIDDLATDFERDARLASLGGPPHPGTHHYSAGMRDAATIVRSLPSFTDAQVMDAIGDLR